MLQRCLNRLSPRFTKQRDWHKKKSNRAQTGAQGPATLFDTEPPETVIRARVDGLIRRAGIQQNYQLLTKPGTGKQTQKLTIQNRERLVLYLYFKHIETEETELAEIAEQAAEAETFDMLMDAWLSEDTESDTDEKNGRYRRGIIWCRTIRRSI